MIDGNDRVRNDKSRTPRFTGGLNVDLGYKDFDLSFLLQGAMGGVFYQTTESGDFANFLKSFMITVGQRKTLMLILPVPIIEVMNIL